MATARAHSVPLTAPTHPAVPDSGWLTGGNLRTTGGLIV
jgi:hypothetical protein